MDRVRAVRRALVAVVVTAAALGTVGCADAATCQDFAVSLAVTTGGAATPVEAARRLAATSQFDLPDDGWRDGVRDADGVEVVAGRSILHTVQGTDGTWFVDSGRCG